MGMYQKSNLENIMKSLKKKGDTSEHLIALLETRLDAIIYRMNIAPTVFAARQLINHGHIEVNNRRVTIPSFSVSTKDVICVRKNPYNIL